MIFIYWYRQNQTLTSEFFGMALSQALFIVILSLFMHGLAQTALRLRDSNLGRLRDGQTRAEGVD